MYNFASCSADKWKSDNTSKLHGLTGIPIHNDSEVDVYFSRIFLWMFSMIDSIESLGGIWENTYNKISFKATIRILTHSESVITTFIWSNLSLLRDHRVRHADWIFYIWWIIISGHDLPPEWTSTVILRDALHLWAFAKCAAHRQHAAPHSVWVDPCNQRLCFLQPSHPAVRLWSR